MGKLFLHAEDDPGGEELAGRLSQLGFATGTRPGDARWDVLVRWGHLGGEDNYPLVLNERQALEDLSSRVPACLRANRVRVTSAMGGRGRYRVFACNLRSLAVYRRTARGYARLRRRLARIRRRAVRSLHFLGLDFGAVDLTAGGYVCGVDPSPSLPSDLAGPFARALADMANELEKLAQARRAGDHRRSAVLGADPEFMLISRRTGRMVPASIFFPRFGFVGCDERAVWTPRMRRALAEIRPRPRADPRELAGAIRDGLRRALRRTARRRVMGVAGNMPVRGFPTGGHIHFSRCRLGSRFLRALDNYLALLLLMVENAHTARRRRRRYGYLADLRSKRHGFEYRTPGSWLVSQDVANGALCLAKVIADDHDCLKAAPLRDPALVRAFYQCDKAILGRVVPSLWRDLTLAPSYPLYRQELETFRTLIESGWEWGERSDLRRTWGLMPAASTRSRRRRRRR
ncbi:MAG: hypothetical protein RDU89_08575 [bacterium]|nr:hypothetical protein [bacterium]